MLTSNSIAATFPLAEQFDANNIVLTPVAGTPLHHLVAATNALPEMAVKLESGEVSIDTWQLEQAAAAKGLAVGLSGHDTAMNDFIQVSAGAVRGALSLARTVVAPRIADLLDLVTMRLKTATPSELSRVEIITKDECPALHNPAFVKMVSKYENAPPTLPALNLNFGKLSVDEILGKLETGIGSVDVDVIGWAASQPSYVLEEAWKLFFTFGDDNSNSTFNERLRYNEANALLCFLWANFLQNSDELPEGANISLKAYRTSLQNYIEQSGRYLWNVMSMSAVSVKNGVLVKSVVGSSIKVNPPVYANWLESGGDQDILYGMAISQNKAFTVAAIMENANKYRAAWATYVAMVSSTDSTRRFTFLLEQLAACYENLLQKPDADGHVRTAQAVAAEMVAFKEQLRAVHIRDIDDLPHLCQRLVCRASFADTPAELILAKMDEVAKQSPTLTPREAAAMATLWYISSWVGEQITAVTP